MRGDCVAFARHWQAHNARVLDAEGPLWVVLGDSTAQRLGAPMASCPGCPPTTRL